MINAQSMIKLKLFLTNKNINMYSHFLGPFNDRYIVLNVPKLT